MNRHTVSLRYKSSAVFRQLLTITILLIIISGAKSMLAIQDSIVFSLSLRKTNVSNQRQITYQELIKAIEKADLDLVTHLVTAGANVNAKDSYENSALYYAVLHRKDIPSIISLLIQAGAEVNEKNGEGASILLRAMGPPWGRPANILALIDGGANVNSTDKRGWSPLMVAADWGNLPVVLLLLNKGASPNLRTVDGKTALIISTKTFKAKTVEALLKSGADPSIKDISNKTALAYAKEAFSNSKSKNKSIRGELSTIISLLEEKALKK